jgi:hypothetical protein
MTTKKQPIMPDFSGLIRAQKAGKKNTPAAKPAAKTRGKLDQNQPDWLSDTDTKTPAAEPVEVEVIEGGWEEPDEETPAKAGQPLTGIDYKRGGPQNEPDIQRQIAVLEAAIEQGESVPVIVKRYGIDRRTVQLYLAELREETEVNSQVVDLQLARMFEGKIKEFVSAVDKDKLAKASVRDLAIAAGIFADKRKELLGPRSGGNSTTLRVAWRGGEGAIEVKTD